VGQTARLILASFDPQSTPELDAQVATVSPDVIVDERSGQSYYRVSLRLAPEALEDMARMEIVPGMPVEAFLETGDRSVLSYLVHPLAAHLRRALRE
jgi:HlyD family secretion protein